MGRTLHYTAEKQKGLFTKKEAEIMYEVSCKYNRIPKLWTCETFCLDPYNYYPYWRNSGGIAKDWDQINNEHARLKKDGKDHANAVKDMIKQKLVFLKSDNFRKCSDFTKVQGNEFNSLMIYSALIEISKRCPDIKITLSDEGKFLYCKMFIQKGKVIPDLSDIQEDIERWSTIAFINSQSKLARDVHKNIISTMDKDTIREFGLNDCYSHYADVYLKEALNSAKFVMHLIKECWERPHMVCKHNMEISDPNKWFDSNIWHRAVDIEKFKNYKGTPDKLMEGFDGEGFGLADPADSEIKSYKQIAFMQKMVEKVGLNKKNLEILKSV